jgi:hypothetical protein
VVNDLIQQPPEVLFAHQDQPAPMLGVPSPAS